MNIIFTEHSLERITERGTDTDQVKKVIETGDMVIAKSGRKAKEAVFEYNSNWLGKHYRQKKVRAIFVEEADQIVVITVCVYYGYWE